MIRRPSLRNAFHSAGAFALLCALGSYPTFALAATRTVHANGAGPYPTIQAACDASVNGDIIELTNGTFTGPGNRQIVLLNKSVTIRSQTDDPALVILDADGFGVGSCEFAGMSIRGITLRDADFLGLFLSLGEFTNCIFDQCSQVAAAEFGASYTFRDCVITNLTGIGMTGGEGGVEAYNCKFTNNNAQIAIGRDLLFEDCEFTGNDAGSSPLVHVAIAFGFGRATFSRCTFADNSTTSSAACVYSDGAILTVEDCLFARNDGVCVDFREPYNWSPPFIVRRSTFADNSGLAAIRISDPFEEGIPFPSTLSKTIIAFQNGGVAFDCGNLAPEDYPTVSCSDIFGNSGGDYVGCLSDFEGIAGNLSLDPRFCPADLDRYTLQSGSPCLPFAPENPTCGLIGASVAGCSATDVNDELSTDLYGGRAGSWLVASPNPFHGSTILRRRSAPATSAMDGAASNLGAVQTLMVHDAAGRVVRRLSVPRDLPAGGDTPSSVEWDGRDDAGRSLPSGIYYVRDASGVRSAAAPVVMLR